MPNHPMSNLISIAIAAALAVAPSVAYAEPPPEPKANPSAEDLDRAKELFENGKGLFSEGSYDAAIAAFKRAYASSGDPVLLYNIALAYDRAENFDGALEYLEYYRAFAPDSERTQLAEKEESLRKRRLRAQSSEDGGDDSSSGSDTQSGDQGSGESTSSGSPTDTSAVDDGGPAKPKNQQKIFTVPVWILTGVAVAGLGVGTGLGVTALNRRSDADESCEGSLCAASGKSDSESARNLAIGADVAFAVGATAGVVAIALIVNNAVKRKKANRATALVPVRGGAGLAFRF